jgi:alpha-1,3-rhamnosyl/mannosyltransferase
VTRRLGVNLMWLVPGVVGGSEDATVRTLGGLADLAQEAGWEVVLFATPAFGMAHPDLVSTFETVVAPVDGRSRPRRVLAERRWLPGAATAARIDLLHHGGGTIVPATGPPATVTIHDLQPLDLPGNFGWVKRRYLHAVLGPTARRARSIAVPSRFTRDRVIDRLGARPDQVVVVPWPAPEVTAPGEPCPVPDVIGSDRFVLVAAITYPHKNHLVLLDAFARVARDDPDLRLVLVGGTGPAEAVVAERASRDDLTGRVVRLGRVGADLLDQLYRTATLVAVPSRYEGFGLPAVEAMAYGRPLVAARAGALPEVVAPGTPLVDPDDVAGWVEALRDLVGDPQRRAELGAVGRAAVAQRTARATAAAMIELWDEALASGPASS